MVLDFYFNDWHLIVGSFYLRIFLVVGQSFVDDFPYAGIELFEFLVLRGDRRVVRLSRESVDQARHQAVYGPDDL